MKKGINYSFLILAIILIISGLLFLATLSAPASLKFFGNTNYYLFHQLFSIAIGFILAFLAFKIPLNFLKKIAPVLFLINLVLLIIVFLPMIGLEFWGAKRWIRIGNYTLQPSEFLKITAILYLSAWLSNKFSENSKRSWIFMAKNGYHNFVSIFLFFLFLLTVISAILIFQKDISTLAVIIVPLLVIYFLAGAPVWHTILTIAMGLVSALALIKIEPYRMQRLLTFLHPETDPLGVGFQLRQSLLAVGSGGIFGKGLGMSTQKFGFLPQAMGDSVFAILSEEIGIIGCSVLIFLFVLFFLKGIKIAKLAADKFSKLAGAGISTWIIFQSFINIASAIGIWPLSGIPLPFFSYGGSHIIAEMIGVGILLNISKRG